MMNKEYIVKNKDMAKAIVFITGQRYDVVNIDGKECYSFPKTSSVKRIVTEITNLRKEFHVYNKQW